MKQSAPEHDHSIASQEHLASLDHCLAKADESGGRREGVCRLTRCTLHAPCMDDTENDLYMKHHVLCPTRAAVALQSRLKSRACNKRDMHVGKVVLKH